jgi:hypothetical protein
MASPRIASGAQEGPNPRHAGSRRSAAAPQEARGPPGEPRPGEQRDRRNEVADRLVVDRGDDQPADVADTAPLLGTQNRGRPQAGLLLDELDLPALLVRQGEVYFPSPQTFKSRRTHRPATGWAVVEKREK